MNVLFIDDERKPTKALRRAAGIPHEAHVVWAKTSHDALDLLKDGWDEIWFDHDLGIVNGVEDTTMIVAQTLAELAFHTEIAIPAEFAECVIHTQNPVGRDNLELVLTRWGFRVRHVYL